MKINFIQKYYDFFQRTKNEKIIILEGGRRSGKTYSILTNLGLLLFSKEKTKIQIFSEKPEQKSSGLLFDFDDIWVQTFKKNLSKSEYYYKNNYLKFINIPNDIKAFDFAKNIGQSDFRFINEANTFAEPTFENLLISNKNQIILDLNPTKKSFVNKYITENNYLHSTYKDNPFLTNNQIKTFEEWERVGRMAESGSPAYWKWQVYCLGLFCEITGEIFTPENIQFTKTPEKIDTYFIFCDPSNARGGDYFSMVLAGVGDDRMFVVDSFSKNKVEKPVIIELIRKWQTEYSIKMVFVETNGEIGSNFYKLCLNSDIANLKSYYSKNNKYERIIANFDLLTKKVFFIDTEKNRDFAIQIYSFSESCEHDDNIDVVNNALIVCFSFFKKIKII